MVSYTPKVILHNSKHRDVAIHAIGDFQPDKWEEYLKSKHKDSSDSEEDEEEEQQEEGKEKKKYEKNKTKGKKKAKPEGILVDIDEDIPLAKLKETISR